MTTVTEHYGMGGPVPFLDVNVRRDSRLFVDPRALRLQAAPEPFVTAANRCAETFLDEITRCALWGVDADHRRGLDLLQRFTEPKETRLGLSRRGNNCHGGGEDVGQWI